MLNLAILIAAAAAAATPAPQQKSVCDGPQYHQLDFWIGEWNVFQASDNTKVGTSRIESVMDGCGIGEHFEAPDAPGGAYSGTSYSGYDRKDGKWHQMYIDTNGNVTGFAGDLDGSDLVMDAPANGAITRMVYRRLTDGSVEQIGTVSANFGRKWAPRYDYIYRKK